MRYLNMIGMDIANDSMQVIKDVLKNVDMTRDNSQEDFIF